MVLPWSTQWLAKVCRVHQYQTFSGFSPLAGGLQCARNVDGAIDGLRN